MQDGRSKIKKSSKRSCKLEVGLVAKAVVKGIRPGPGLSEKFQTNPRNTVQCSVWRRWKGGRRQEGEWDSPPSGDSPNPSQAPLSRLQLCKKEVAPHRKTQSLYVDDKQVLSSILPQVSYFCYSSSSRPPTSPPQVSSLTNLVVGVTAPVKHCMVLQLHSWTMGKGEQEQEQNKKQESE